MRTCRLCRFETELDDVVIALPSGGCICLRCYSRETGTAHPVPASLQREVATVLAGA